MKMVASIFTGRRALFSEVLARLEERFGPVDFLSELLRFDYTDYYRREFGTGLKRRLLSFERLADPGTLAQTKLYTNGLEEEYLTGDGRRMVNIDPGYISPERFVLATCKNFAHRIYLGDGVYADLTLIYRGGDYRPLEWTYPDYREGYMRDILKRIRNKYLFQMRQDRRCSEA